MRGKKPPAGLAAVLIGNGPSVDELPAEFWPACRRAGVLLIGTNRALAFAALRAVPLDAMVIRDTYRSLWHDPKWGCLYHEQLWKPFAGWQVGPAHARVTHCDEFVRFEGGWQDRPIQDANREPAVMAQSSVVLMAANWAWQHGGRRIFLIGVDYAAGPGGPHPRMIKPYDRAEVGWQGQYDRPPSEAVERQYEAARAAVERLGGGLWNLSPRSRLRAVRRADGREVLGEVTDAGGDCLRQPAMDRSG